MATTKRGGSKLITATKAAALAEHRAQLAALAKLIRRRLTTIVESFYDIGLSLDEIQRKKLYAARGFTSLDAFVVGAKLMSPAQAAKLVAIVRNVPREQAIARGVRSLVKAAGVTPTGVTVARGELRVVLSRAAAAKALGL